MAVEEDSPAAESRQIDERVLRFIPLILLLALVLLPFLPEHVAAATTARLFIGLFVLIAVLDILMLRVPNLLIYPAIAFSLVATAIVDPDLVLQALAGGGGTLGIMFVIAVLARGAMGMGDVKLACLSGCVLGLRIGIASLVVGFAAGAIVSLPVMLIGKRSRKDTIPLTPFLAAGTIFCAWAFDFLVTR